MDILQIRQLSVNSINLGYSLSIEVGQIFPNLFIGGNRTIVFLEYSFVRSDVYFFVQDSTIRFQWSVAALFQYTFVETFAAKVMFIGGDVKTAACYTTHTKLLRTTEFFFDEARLSLIMLFVFHTTFLGKKVATVSAMKLSTGSFDCNLCHSALISSLTKSFNSFSA